MPKFEAAAVTPEDSASLCTGPCCGFSRRKFMTGMASMAVAGSMAPAKAQTTRRLIDVHHHYFADAFRQSMESEGGVPPFVKAWSPQRMLEEMDKNQISKSILSLSSVPTGWFRQDSAALRPMIRTINEYGAKLVDDHKGRHALYAYVMAKDVEGALKEIEFAFDHLKADGIGMSTNFGDKWPGDPALAPVFDELNRRKAIVYFHPTSADCCGNLIPSVPASWIEYPHDTTRAIASLLFSGTLARFRDIKWVFSHSGGTLPFLANRIDWQSRPQKDIKSIAPDGVLNEFKKLYFETANAASAPTLNSLLKLIPSSQIMYGSDFPYVTSEYNLANLRGQGLQDDVLSGIEYRNAETLVPRLKL